MKHILFVEDDAWLAQMYLDAIEPTDGLEVNWVKTADEALMQLDEKPVDLIILDMFLPGHSGVEFLYEIASYSDTKKYP